MKSTSLTAETDGKRCSENAFPQSSKKRNIQIEKRFHLFCDLDGVLCDFNGGVKKICGKEPNELNIGRMWAAVARNENFFEHLEWTNDGRELWEAIQHLEPNILTGVPNNQTVKKGLQKATWCNRELNCGTVNHVDMAAHSPQRHEIVSGEKLQDVVNVISCWGKFKYKEACTLPGAILIDDRQKFQADWERAGGIFVHHVTTKYTLQQLCNYGVIEASTSSENGEGKQEKRGVAEDMRPDTP
jgi:hypothetical protein